MTGPESTADSIYMLTIREKTISSPPRRIDGFHGIKLKEDAFLT
jgi:hypothetical protein